MSGSIVGFSVRSRLWPSLRLTLREPVTKRGAVLINLLKCAGDVVHVGARPKEQALFKPDALFAADQVAVRAADLAVIEPGSSLRQKWSERFVSEHRLVVQRKAISGRARDALRLEGLEDRAARSAKLLPVNAQHE